MRARTHHTAGDPVEYGVYLSLWPFDVQHVGVDGEALQGIGGANYRRVPMWAALLVSPILGGAFVLLFPLFIAAAIVYASGLLLRRGLSTLLGASPATEGPAVFAPGAAWLGGRNGVRPTSAEAGDGEGAEELVDLEREVEERRSDDKEQV